MIVVRELVKLVTVESTVVLDDEVPDCWNAPEMLFPELVDVCWFVATVV